MKIASDHKSTYEVRRIFPKWLNFVLVEDQIK